MKVQNKYQVWGIDLGGTKIEGVVLDVTNNIEPVWRDRIDTEANLGYHHILKRIAILVRRMKSETGLQIPRVIGIGTPGIRDPTTKRMRNCNTTCLNGRDLKNDLTDILNTSVLLENDANCFTLAEAKLGAGAAYDTVFGVIMGTGVGGGIVLRNELRPGLHHIAGEWGHNVLVPEGPPCYCGLNGCVETILSGPALETFYHDQTGKRLSLKTIVQRHHEAIDDAATQTVKRLIHFFGMALAQVVNVLDPDVLVLGGGLGNIALLHTEGRDSLYHFVFHEQPGTVLKRPQLGDSAGVFGASLLTLNLP